MTKPIVTVAVEPLREAFLASGLSAYEVARRLGWQASPAQREARIHYDGQRVRRRLGLCAYRQRRGRQQKVQTRMHYRTAVLLCDAIGVDPVDVGC